MIRRDSSFGAQRDRWMVSYLDVVTILLVFFVAAAAKTLAPPAKPSPPPPPPAPPKAAAPKPVRDELAEKLSEAGIDVRREPRGLVASLPQAVLFGPGDDRISPEALPALERIATVLQATVNNVIVVGHADAAPIHNLRFANNWELSVARGMRVLELLAGQYHIDERRLSVSGESSYRPAGSDDTFEGRAANRRVELVILDSPASP